MRAVMQPPPPLAPHDSLKRLLKLLRQHAADSLPVLANGKPIGVAAHADVAELMLHNPGVGTETLLRRPVAEILRPIAFTAAPTATLDSLLQHSADQSLMHCIPVVDAQGYCLGIVHPLDIVTPPVFTPRLPTIGGMATPLGVYLYLADGSIQSGVGNLALVASGALTAVMFWGSTEAAQSALTAFGRLTHLANQRALDLDFAPPITDIEGGLISLALRVGLIVLFLVLMRLSPLAGYHAAEHQTVHAIEAGESLVPEIVQRMPRDHPRCGTNLMAALMLFMTLRSLFELVPATRSVSEFLAVLVALFTWRRFGTLLQLWFTTRPASDRQLASGIRAGNALLGRYAASPPYRPRPLRRIWCMGLIQSMVGMLLVVGVLWLVGLLWPGLHL